MVVTGPDSLADSLADDLWQHILSQLCLIDVSNCARVTKRLRNVSQSDSIWSTLYEKEFNVRCCPRVHQTYKDAFRERYPHGNKATIAHQLKLILSSCEEPCRSEYACREKDKQACCGYRAKSRYMQH